MIPHPAGQPSITPTPDAPPSSAPLGRARGATLLAALLLCLAACNGAIDVSVSRGPMAIHFNDVGCAATYSGDRGAGPSAIDLTCPANLRPRGAGATLHISTPLVTGARRLDLRDTHFLEPGYQLGQFVVVTYQDGGRTISCDPLDARGAITYSSVPKAGAEGRIAGQFSDDAALLHCTSEGAPDAGGPLLLSGSFDVGAPVR